MLGPALFSAGPTVLGRLAREMHDVVSHQVGLIAVEAGVLAVTSPEPEARRAGERIGELGSRTLDELHAMLGALRGTAAPGGLPGLADLPALIAASGLPAFTVSLSAPPGRAALTVEVLNTRPPRAPSATRSLQGRGHGLMGLRERAALLGGTARAEPTPDGGFAVRATLPCRYPSRRTPAEWRGATPATRPNETDQMAT